MQNSKLKFVLVYSTFKQDEVALIKSLLDAAKIQYYITNESPYLSAADFQLIDIMVILDKVREAKKLLKDFIEPFNEEKK